MGRLVRKRCPRCHERDKLAGKGYCLPCQKDYQKEYNALYKARRQLKACKEPAPPAPKEELMADWDLEPNGRLYLGLKDNHQPSTDYLAAYCGWQIDRHTAKSYGINQRNGSIDSTGYYLVGHYAVQRFWHRTGGTAWEMGPDLELVVDGQATGANVLLKKRFWHKVGGGLPHK